MLINKFLCSILFFILTAGIFQISPADETEKFTCAEVVRNQLKSMAEEVVNLSNLNPNNRVTLFVDGEEPRSLAENAFIEVLQNKGFTSVVKSEIEIEQMLHISILNVNIKVRELENKLSERTIRTMLEAKTVTGQQREVKYLGKFQRQTADTAEVFSSAQLASAVKVENGGIMQRILTPFIVISGVVVVIYLFFTVRS